MNNTKAKTLTLLCIALSLMGIVMLFFPILTYTWFGKYSVYDYSDSGFSLLLFEGDGIDEEATILGLLSWGQLITGIIMLIKSLLMLKKQQTSAKSFISVVIAIGICAFLYLLEGIVATSITYSNGGIGASHSTWIPFGIITALSITAIIYIDSYKKETAVNYSSPQRGPVFGTVQNQTTSQYSANYQASSNQTAGTVAQNDGCVYTVDGEVKLLKIYDDYVTLENKVNLRAIVTNNVFGGTKKIFYQNMIGVQFKESSTLVLGYIQFETANTFSKDNFNSENSVTFSHLKVPNEYARQIVDFVEKKIVASKAPVTVTQTVSSADELLKYKSLLDAGAISQEEYDKKKNELLGK